MNCLSKELFAKCAELLKKDAAKRVEAAEAELKSMRDMLEEVKKGGGV
jgi:predicted translin family RNA/ssDNA-binding protein